MPSARNVLSRTIFTGDNLDNIVWKRATSHNDPKRFGRILDHLLYYSRGTGRRWNADAVTIPKDAGELLKAYPAQDERGRYRPDNLTGPRHNAKRGSPSTMPWKGYDVYAMNRVWSAPKTGKYAEYIEKNFIPGYREIEGIHDRLEALDNAGLIHHPRTGKWPGLKRYADADTGNPAQNLFLHPTGFTNFSTKDREYTGWKTQKPVALLEQLIKASSNPGDLVLDPFCGCATACIAAEKLGRDWIGIDKLPEAAAVLTQRARRELQIPLDMTDGKGWEDWTPVVLNQPPRRSDLALLSPANPQSDKELLYASQNRKCIGCEYELPLHVLTIDHITPRSRSGTDTIGNLQLMCHTCNAIKGDRTMQYLREQLHRRGIVTI